MMIVNDIQDAVTIKKVLSSLVCRSVNGGKNERDILTELLFMIEDLEKNIDRIEFDMKHGV